MAVRRYRTVVVYASAFLAIAIAQTQGTGVISGSVLDGESGDPVRKAILTLTLEGLPRRWATAQTDASGHFSFDALPAGKYELRATKVGEGTAIYGANQPRELGEAIVLGDGETRSNLKLRFLRGAWISGHVYDSDGEPVADGSVSLLREGRNFGVLTPTLYRNTSSDDRGAYNFANVDAGRYYLYFRSRLGSTPAVGQSILAQQYYGGVRDLKDSTVIHVGGSESLVDLDFHVTAERAVTIRGRVAGIPEDQESAGAGVEIWITRLDFLPRTFNTGAPAPDYRFRLGAAGMVAGRYQINAEYQASGKAYSASQVVEVQPDSGEIVLTLAPALDIHGTLRIEGTKPSREDPPVRVQLQRPADPRRLSATVGTDGRFAISQVPAGEWQLAVNPMPPGFLKLAKYGDKDVRFSSFEPVTNTDAALNIVVSMRTATVKGKVDGPQGKRAGILIAPVGAYHDFTCFYYAGMTDEDGKFHVEGIAPGKYKIFTIEKMAAENFRSPEAADQLDELGEAIDLAEGATVEAHPKVIPADRAVQALQ